MQISETAPRIYLLQGYLLKRYTTLGMDSWKKRFFVIDSKGDLYYLVRALSPTPWTADARRQEMSGRLHRC